jgi:hypothetical protein
MAVPVLTAAAARGRQFAGVRKSPWVAAPSSSGWRWQPVVPGRVSLRWWFPRYSCSPTLRLPSFLTYHRSECADGDDAARRYRYGLPLEPLV